ncbi:protein ATP6V1FNB [Venturia canescens]|uniref:protein ATP6V1FNB n=1 Tax=Venturia canescens TaxID=32260 RepID=UPI001C9D5DEC|nr:protein ATP6V1FNB-like [Venturia canescens]
MKPVDPSVREILYNPGESSYITTNKYLRQRYKDKPEDRYYFPDCTYWLHGWRLGDHPPVPGTKVGRKSIIRAWFYRRNGVNMKRDDPKRSPQSINPKNFNDLLTY